MKTKFKRFSKRTLSLVLAALMMFSTMLVGTISTVNAVEIPAGTVLYIDATNFTATQDQGIFVSVPADTNTNFAGNKEDTSGVGYHQNGSFYVPKNDTWYDTTSLGNNIYSVTITAAAPVGKISLWSKKITDYEDVWEVNCSLNQVYDGTNNFFTVSSGYNTHEGQHSPCFSGTWSVYPGTGETTTLYLDPSGCEDAQAAADYYANVNGTLIKFTKVGNDAYPSAQIPSGTTSLVVDRYAAGADTSTDTAWNSTADVTYDGTKNLLKLTGYDGATMNTEWSNYTPGGDTGTKYYIGGNTNLTGVSWVADNADDLMTDNDGDGTYTSRPYTVNTGVDYLFKVSDGNWDDNIDWGSKYLTADSADYAEADTTDGKTDGNHNIKLKVAQDNSTAVITFNPTGGTDGAGSVTVVVTPPVQETSTAPSTTAPPTEAPTYSNEHVYTNPTVTLNTNLTSVKAGETVTLTAEITNKLYDTYQGKISEYNGRLVYNFYKMTGTTPDTTKDTLVRTRTGTYTSTGANTATVTDFTVYEDSTLYVVAYPSSDRTASGMSDTVTIKNTTKSGSVNDVTVYVDFGAATVTGTPSITTVTSAGATKDYDLTLVGGNIYRAVNVTASYFVDGEGTAATYTSDFNVKYITVNGQTVYLSEAHQPDINALLESKIVWYKSTVTDFTNNLSSTSFEINETDEISKHADLSSEVVEQDMNVEADFVYTTKRLYITDNLPWNNLYIYYSSAETDKFSAGGKMTEAGLNRYSQTYYYYDLPADADQFYVTNAETSPTKTSETVTLSAVFSRTSENAYYFTGDNTLGLWTDNDYPQTPGIEKSYSDIYISVGDTLNITPSAYEANLSLDYAVTEGADRITITKSDDYAATLSAVAVGTGTGAGTATFTITPHGYLQEYEDQNTHEIKKAGNAYGVPVEITVHIVDKTRLNMLIANGATAIANKATGKAEYDYNEVMYSNFVSAQARAKSLYCTSYDQAVIDAAAANLRNALNALYVLDSTNMTEEFNLLSYNSSTVKFNKNGNGAIGAPTSAESNCIITTEADGSYTVFYAYGTAGYVVNGITLYTGLDVNCLADDSGAGSDPFENWTSKIGTATTADVASTAKGITLTAPAGVSTYTANFTAMVRAKLKYNFEDFDPEEAGQYEYKENCTKAASYTTADFSMPAADLTNSSNLMNYAELKAPNIVSNYFNYSLAPVADQTFSHNTGDGTSATPYVIEVKMTGIPVAYTITLPGAKTLSCHYNELVTLSASDYGITEGTDVYWYIADQDAGTEQVLSTSFDYQFRATHNITLSMDANTAGKAVASGSTVTASYTKFFPNDNNQECVGQCFYIQNFIPEAEKENFVGAGIFYFMYNDTTKKPSLSAITDTVIGNMSSYATEIAQNTALTYNGSVTRGQHSSKLNYVYVDYAKDKAQSGTAQKLRYSTVEESFNLIYEISAVSNPSRANYSYHVYSFYVYKDSNGDYWAKVSTSYAEAKYYVAQTA